MNIFGYLQRIGKALMVPIATLPAAGLMIGIGYAIDPAGWGGNSPIAAFLIGGGGAIMDNQAWLFAVGVAYGLARDNNGAAALAGLVGLMIFDKLLDPGMVANLTNTTVEALGADSVRAYNGRLNALTGLIFGVVAAEFYNRFHNIQLPSWLSFFGGRRFVPIASSVAALAISLIFIIVWPSFYNGLISFGKSILDLGAVGAGIYGVVNRLMIPLGLHHAINAVFWWDVAGINDIPTFWSGVGELGVTGMYQAGFFPIMGYGLPAACLAIYHTAHAKNKQKVGSLMLAIALTAIVTGVTEPIEFAFMYVAPALYVIHACLTGLSLFLAAAFGWIAGFNFSGGLIDFVLSFNTPLAHKPYMLIVQGIAFAAIYYTVFRFAIVKFDLKTPGREVDDENDTVATEEGLEERAAAYLKALGGEQNLGNIDACITRLRLEIKDVAQIDEPQLKRLGAMGVVKVGEKNLQVIIGSEAELVASAMKSLTQ
ncbi:N-acetylglucosamine-specific PTS transporter subunit IIBC [Thaumasiovibrio subtropicus]|uniref:N-acetylglucosamine-specific PTS transporter subunit IIBC n=1 Tax=Thaumasiovibrio subtropicus TaxID=1891207 RepID=UPI000B350CCB|nr:N-acetylglucosamine-specific PTS transporter subunit IIBC [Thaumasiovibrio subtropicus]